MRDFKRHITELYSHVKKAEAKWPAGLACIVPGGGQPTEMARLHESAKRASEAEQSQGKCSFLATAIEEMFEAGLAANAGDWGLCYSELADTGAVVLRAMELIHPKLKENQQ